MPLTAEDLRRFLESVHPYDQLPPARLDSLLPLITPRHVTAGEPIYALGDALPGLFIIETGEVEVTDAAGSALSLLGPRNSFGERGLMARGTAVTAARARADTALLLVPADTFAMLREEEPVFAKFYTRARPDRAPRRDLAHSAVGDVMTRTPLTCQTDTTVQAAAAQMAAAKVSSLCVTDGATLEGILTLRDLSGKVLAQGLPFDTPVAQIMTASPLTLPPSAIGSDVLHLMLERRIGHVPIVQEGHLVGIVTRTDLVNAQAVNASTLVSGLASASGPADMAKITARIPELLVQLIAGGARHEIATRLISDIADAATRRLLALAEAQLGPAPHPYLWLACGSQGRQEQTGTSDQDNCLILDDAVTADDMPYYAALAKFVCDGLDAIGYIHCPGEMMAMTPRWCQPRRVWRDYFTKWIARPDGEAQMLASVMFDLRPIGGDEQLFDALQGEVLERAAKNSIFVAHMASNALGHAPPLGLWRGLATIKSGEHRNTLDLKMTGVVPVVDLARVYALQGKLRAVNTRARLEAAMAAGVLSERGGRVLLDAYDLIAETRLIHQMQQIRGGGRPDNFLPLTELSEFDRAHLRDAFVVVKTQQAALGHGRGGLS